MAPTPEQARMIAGLKSAPPREFLLPVVADNSAAGSLTPVTHRMAEEADLVDALFRWRRAHMTAFLTVFVPTPEKTRHYLTAFALPDPARILFLIERHDRPVGHIGLCNIAADGAEIDNVMRGEPVDAPGFMIDAHHALMRWAFSTLDVPLVYLNVLADNARAIHAYQKAGLGVVGRMPLRREDFDGGYRLVPAADCGSVGGRRELLRMEISRSAFLAHK
jgi:RimJ/RimL family protein N-acetyltransferase